MESSNVNYNGWICKNSSKLENNYWQYLFNEEQSIRIIDMERIGIYASNASNPYGLRQCRYTFSFSNDGVLWESYTSEEISISNAQSNSYKFVLDKTYKARYVKITFSAKNCLEYGSSSGYTSLCELQIYGR